MKELHHLVSAQRCVFTNFCPVKWRERVGLQIGPIYAGFWSEGLRLILHDRKGVLDVGGLLVLVRSSIVIAQILHIMGDFFMPMK